MHLVGLAPIADPDLVPSAIARALGVRESGDRALARCDRRPARGHRRAALPRQPRAPPRRGGSRRRPPRPRAGSPDPDDEPLTAPPLDRARPPPRASDDRGRNDALHGARRRTRRRPPPGGACVGPRDLPTTGRAPARHRARRGAPGRASTCGDRPGARRGTGARDGGSDRPPRAPTNAARGDRLELRPAHREPASCCTAASRCSATARRSTTRERSLRRRRRSSPDLEALVGWSLVRSEASDGDRPPVDARDGSRACSRSPPRERRTRRPARASRRALPRARARRRERARRARARPCGSTGWSASSTTSPPRSTGCSPSAASRTRCARSRRSSASGAATRTSRGAALARPGARARVRHAERRARGGAAHGLASQAAAQSDWAGAVTSLTEARELYHDLGDGREQVFALSLPQLLCDPSGRHRAVRSDSPRRRWLSPRRSTTTGRHPRPRSRLPMSTRRRASTSRR